MSRSSYVLMGVALVLVIILAATVSYDVLLALVGIIIGGAITFAASRYYYQRASDDLRKEAEQLRRKTEDAAGRLARETKVVRHYINALITYLEAAGVISVVRNEEGVPIETTIISLSGASLGVSGLAATIKVDDPPEGEGGEDAPDRGTAPEQP
jgi:hypothetical protein